jgi:hypothetical protein
VWPCDLGDAGQGGLHHEHVEVDRPLGNEGGVDDRADRLRQHRHVRPEEALPFGGLHRPEVHDRLELDVVVLFEGEEVVEDLVLGDLGCLVEADPISQPGDVDRVAESGHVPLRDGQG